ncbi:MAG TPA: hypothetical protein PKE45_24595, partial [Caldilineaceae bacterium]|nr:hypothetical protein [Caldilineaceae bacterium]
EPAAPAMPSPAPLEAPTPQPIEPAASVTISAVGVFRKEVPGVLALTLNPGEAFEVQARFQLQGPEALSLTAQEPSYEMQVYAHEVISGTSPLVTRYAASLAKDVLDYSAQIQVPGLARGLYRLHTWVKLWPATRVAGHYEGPIVHVAE